MGLAIVASRLCTVAMAYPGAELDLSGISGDAVFSSPGYIIPAGMDPEEIDENADYMVLAEPLGANHTGDFVDILPAQEVNFDVEVPATPNTLNTRAEGTTVFIGSKLTDYGCGGTIDSIRSFVGDAVYGLCKGGFCDGGREYARKVTWMANGGFRKSAWLTATMEGTYRGDATLGNIHNLVKASVQRETVSWAWRYYDSRGGQIAQSCKMAKFTNYMHIRSYAWSSTSVQMRVSLNKVEASCLAFEILERIGNTVNGVIGNGLGWINFICQQTS
ncbi:hypothetical protein B0I35DRAFT_474235 [Stachybotrys elegans]|uniref:Uncharacterized protein n=1 Tax=Stachybotrys elegans TaxID=80388 RepID=A0A8K0T3Q0_9HYPO|nr:hypothetical protein B0I35DRAFT_474235 [Stachybotrys elegans]